MSSGRTWIPFTFQSPIQWNSTTGWVRILCKSSLFCRTCPSNLQYYYFASQGSTKFMIEVHVCFCRQNKDSKNKSIFMLEEQFPRVWSLLGNREKLTNLRNWRERCPGWLWNLCRNRRQCYHLIYLSRANQLYNSAK